MDLDLLNTLLVSRFEDRIIPPVGAFPGPRIAMFAAVSCVLGRLRLYRKLPAPSPMVKVSVLEMIPLLWTIQSAISYEQWEQSNRSFSLSHIYIFHQAG